MIERWGRGGRQWRATELWLSARQVYSNKKSLRQFRKFLKLYAKESRDISSSLPNVECSIRPLQSRRAHHKSYRNRKILEDLTSSNLVPQCEAEKEIVEMPLPSSPLEDESADVGGTKSAVAEGSVVPANGIQIFGGEKLLVQFMFVGASHSLSENRLKTETFLNIILSALKNRSKQETENGRPMKRHWGDDLGPESEDVHRAD